MYILFYSNTVKCQTDVSNLNDESEHMSVHLLSHISQVRVRQCL